MGIILANSVSKIEVFKQCQWKKIGWFLTSHLKFVFYWLLVRKTSPLDRYRKEVLKIKNDFKYESLLNHILKWTPLRNLVSCPVHIREFCEDYQKSHRVWLHCRHPVWLLPYREIPLSAQPSVLNRATRKDEYTIRYIFITKTQEHWPVYLLLVQGFPGLVRFYTALNWGSLDIKIMTSELPTFGISMKVSTNLRKNCNYVNICSPFILATLICMCVFKQLFSQKNTDTDT